MTEQISLFDFYDIEQEEINKNDMRWYIRAVHDDDKDTDTFIIWSEKRVNGPRSVWKQHGSFIGLIEHVRKISLTARKDVYLSLQTFVAPFRRNETLFKLNAIAFDVDAHGAADPAEAIFDALYRFNRDIFEDNILPLPSMIIYTGRGLQIVYLLEPLPRQGMPFWSLVGEAMAKRLRTSLDERISINLDDNYTDITRVLRIPGTYNTAAGRYARIVAPEEGEELSRYRLDALRDEYLPELIIPSAKPVKQVRPDRVSHLFNAYTLHMARLDDLVKLLELREGSKVPIDGRRRMVFLYRYWSCFCVGQEAALEAALAFNARFYEPLPDKTVIKETQSAEKAYTAWKEDNKKGYNYRNDTLIRLLGITEEEQTHLDTIIGKTEKNRRQRDKNWYNNKRNDERAEASKSRDNDVIRLLQENYSYKMIETKIGVTRRTISKIAKANGIIRKQGQRVDIQRNTKN